MNKGLSITSSSSLLSDMLFCTLEELWEKSKRLLLVRCCGEENWNVAWTCCCGKERVVLHWCKYNLYLVSVPDSKPTPARITFSIVCYTGSDIRAGWGLGTRLPIPEAIMRLSVLFMSAQLSNRVIECNNSEATNEWLSLHYGSNWFIMQTSNFTACSS